MKALLKPLWMSSHAQQPYTPSVLCKFPSYFDGFYLLPTSFLGIGSKATFTQLEISFKMVYNMTMFVDFQIFTNAPGAQNLIGDFHQFRDADKS